MHEACKEKSHEMATKISLELDPHEDNQPVDPPADTEPSDPPADPEPSNEIPKEHEGLAEKAMNGYTVKHADLTMMAKEILAYRPTTRKAAYAVFGESMKHVPPAALRRYVTWVIEGLETKGALEWDRKNITWKI